MRRRRKAASGDGSGSGETEPMPGIIDQESGEVSEPPSYPAGWGAVVTDTLKISDPAGLARRLRKELQLGDDRTSYGIVLRALDRSAQNYDDAARLYRAAKLEEETYRLRTHEELEALRSRARGDLEREKAKAKAAGRSVKPPTIQEIEDRVIADWPDRFKTIKTREASLHAAVRSLESLVSAWSSRCADLRIMADKARPH